MRNFQFENIWLLSHTERRARTESFHPKRNLILGRNHTGKSTLIKTLFLTLGARPKGKLIRWDEETASLVTFLSNGVRYRALHRAGHRALFDDSGKLILATGNSRKWASVFTEITGFNLLLSNKEGQSIAADPKCFFLPFYINQDGSWQSTWDTFEQLQQYKNPVSSILDFFTGVRPPEYYEAKSKRDLEQKILEELEKESSFLNRAKDRFTQKMPYFGPKIEPINFDRDIALLTAEVTKLNQKQELLRSQAVKEREALSSIKLQIHLAEVAQKEYQGDANYLRTEQRDSLVCPVCNAEHSEPFLDLLTFADDARTLRDVTIRLYEDAKLVEEKVNATIDEIGTLEVQYQKISTLLDTRRGEIQFKEVVESRGAERAFQAFEEESENLQSELAARMTEVQGLTSKMKEHEDPKKAKVIKEAFRNHFTSGLHSLNLQPIDASNLKITSRPNVSGSGGPRSILAYYAALWALSCSDTGSFIVPIVIDSPNQQGQDDLNLPKVIEFVSSKLPDNTQLILGSEIDTTFKFDKKIWFDVPYQLLNEETYEEAVSMVDPLIQAMYDGLKG